MLSPKVSSSTVSGKVVMAGMVVALALSVPVCEARRGFGGGGLVGRRAGGGLLAAGAIGASRRGNRNGSNNSGADTSTIAIVVTIVAVLIILALLAFLFYSRKKRKHRNKKNAHKTQPAHNPAKPAEPTQMHDMSAYRAAPQHNDSAYSNGGAAPGAYGGTYGDAKPVYGKAQSHQNSHQYGASSPAEPGTQPALYGAPAPAQGHGSGVNGTQDAGTGSKPATEPPRYPAI